MAIKVLISSPFLLLSCFILHSCFLHLPSDASVTGNNREALEIVIVIGGGGGHSHTPPVQSPGCPPPPTPPVQSPGSPPPPAPLRQPPSLQPPKSPVVPSPCPPPPRSTLTPEGPADINAIQTILSGIKDLKNRIKTDPMGITKTWMGGNACKYKGFACDPLPTNRRKRGVAAVDFNGYGFSGLGRDRVIIDGFIEKVPDIAIFHANSNNFTGVIGPKIANLPYLYELDLSNNKFEGGFPMAVLNCKQLSFLDLRYNLLSGPVSPQVFDLKLDVLFLNDNEFDQTLPENFGNTTVLYLTLANNKFTGGIPASIGRACDTLTEVLFLNNQLSGCLPYQIGFLKKATIFDASKNRLAGPIPDSFGCLAKMEQLSLGNNMLYGTVPELVCKLPKILNVSLPNNYITQVGPECRKLIAQNKLDVKNNCIRDLPNQRAPADCARFFSENKPLCPNEKVFSIVPCNVNSFPKEVSHATGFESSKAALGPAPSPSYAALVRP